MAVDSESMDYPYPGHREHNKQKAEGQKKEQNLSELSLEELWQLFPIVLTEHQPVWKAWFEAEREALGRLLSADGAGSPVRRIEHVGSTSVETIWAKPIIDILVELELGEDMGKARRILEQSGYTCMMEHEDRLFLNKGYTPRGFAKKVYHLHLRAAGDHDELYFRDYLKDHPDVAGEYEALKLKLWKLYEHNRDAYTDSKTDFVRKYTREAKILYGDKYE